MKRWNQILAGLLGVQLILIVLVFLPRLLPSQTQSAPLLGNLKTSDLVKVTIADKDGNAITLSKKDAGWTLPQFEDYTANGDQITQFVNKLVGIKTDVLATNTAGSLKQLQVADDNFVRKIDLQAADGTVHTVYLGSPSGGSATNVRLGGQNNVYVARGLSSFEAATDVGQWINQTYLSVPQDKMLSATIENAQGKFEFSNNANLWTMKNLPGGGRFNQDALITTLARLGSLTMVRPLGKEAKPEYGLDKPTATVTVVVSDTASTKVYTLRVGAKGSDGNYPVISSESPWYVQVAAFNVEPFINAKTDTFLVQPTATPTAEAPPTSEATPLATTEPITATATLTATGTLTATTSITPTVTPKP